MIQPLESYLKVHHRDYFLNVLFLTAPIFFSERRHIRAVYAGLVVSACSTLRVFQIYGYLIPTETHSNVTPLFDSWSVNEIYVRLFGGLAITSQTSCLDRLTFWRFGRFIWRYQNNIHLGAVLPTPIVNTYNSINILQFNKNRAKQNKWYWLQLEVDHKVELSYNTFYQFIRRYKLLKHLKQEYIWVFCWENTQKSWLYQSIGLHSSVLLKSLVDWQTEQKCKAEQDERNHRAKNYSRPTIPLSVPDNNIEDRPTRDK